MIFSLLLLSAAQALQVVTTIPELAWVTQKIVSLGGVQDVQVQPLLKGAEDPHFVDANPSFILKTASADILCRVGLDLEIGWLPKVLDRAANSRVAAGGPGDCDASRHVTVLEKLSEQAARSLDRSAGDVHAAGNPHYWLSPLALIQSAEGIRDHLVQALPAQSALIAKGYAAIKAEVYKRFEALKTKLGAARPKGLEFHKEFTYFFNAYGLSSLGSLEEKPGLPPSAARIATVATQAKAQGALFLLTTPLHPASTGERFRELSGIPVLTAPSMIQPGQDYFVLQEKLIELILTASRDKK